MAIKIRKSREGTLRAIAAKNGGIKRDGKISKKWARAYLKKKGVRESTKRKIRFFLNFNK